MIESWQIDYKGKSQLYNKKPTLNVKTSSLESKRAGKMLTAIKRKLECIKTELEQRTLPRILRLVS